MNLTLKKSYLKKIKKVVLIFIRYLIKFIKLPWRKKCFIIEAFFLMGLARMAILIFPFRYIASIIGNQMAESSYEVNDKSHLAAHEIGYIVQRLSSWTPWESKCLVKALAAQIMLKNRHIPTTLYLGIAKDGTEKLLAHAWLRCGEIIVTGNKERSMFRPVAHFTSLPISDHSIKEPNCDF